jgi:dTDP-3-amino-2,3,6-trideoxy-4-keto-D-glucose/dTDP-3-amino-3,4,6-trideoxy-alpha-D-glucose/dTDP-2,6-dideoxy-D-kanosamine transaminase
MNVPFNDTRRRFSSRYAELFSAWNRIFEKGIFVGGPAVERFEEEYAAFCGAPHCVSLANGTDALEFALRALDVNRGDEVITVANAGGYTTAACHAVGAIPVYVDVDPKTLQLDWTAIEPALTANTRVLVVTHLYGLFNDIARIRQHLDRFDRQDVKIIEDCAQAHGAARDGVLAGTVGDIGAFSFYPTKNLGALGDAGAVLCRDNAVAEKIRQLRQYGWDKKYHTVIAGGRNSRMDPLQAVVLSQQLPSLMTVNLKRNTICKHYAECLPTGWGIIHRDGTEFIGHLAVLIAPNSRLRDHARQLLADRQIGHDIHYPFLDCDQPGWRGSGRIIGTLDRSREMTERIISVPCFAEMSDSELNEVSDALRKFDSLGAG